MIPAVQAGKPGRSRKPRRAFRAAAVASAVLAVALAAGCAAQPAPRTASTVLNPAHAGHSGNIRQNASASTDAAASCNPEASSLAPNGPATVSAGSFAETIRNRGYLIAGVDQGTYRFGFLNPIDNKFEGFDIEMVNAVAQAIFGADYAKHIQFKAIHNSDRIPELTSGGVDLVADTMTINCPRLQQIDFSSVYLNAQAQLLVLKTPSAPQSLASLKGRKVCATTGSDDIAIIGHYHAIPVEPTYWTDCLVDLQQGLVAGIVTDNAILYGLEAQDPFTEIVGGNLEPEPYGLGIAKTHPDFVRFVNAVLARLESSGRWEQYYKQWVSPAGVAAPVPQYAP